MASGRTGGTGRLTRSQTAATVSRTYGWVYDVFGNRAETFTSTGGEGCQGTAPLEYGADNRLVARHSFPGCSRLSRYWTDQAGNRLGETDTAGVAQAQMTYTAAGQLYYSLTPTVQVGTYDYNWHWYDGDGRRILTQASSGTTIVAPRPETAGGILSYYVYDGSDVALVLARQGTSWWVKQRPLVAGVDQVLAGRYSAAGTQYQNLALVADRQGSTVAAVKADGAEELSALYPGRNAFGALEGASAGGGTNTESGYTGASTPNQTGGFTYLRNRWYDPATGRFLTQDPIGLAGGVNLYAYAGNDPVMYSDPFGLCKEVGNCVQGDKGVEDALDHVEAAAARRPFGDAHSSRVLADPRSSTLEKVGALLTIGATMPGTLGGLGEVGEGASALRAWHKGTFPSEAESAQYHLGKHGGARALEQYTQDAVDFFTNNSGRGSSNNSERRHRSAENQDPGRRTRRNLHDPRQDHHLSVSVMRSCFMTRGRMSVGEIVKKLEEIPFPPVPEDETLADLHAELADYDGFVAGLLSQLAGARIRELPPNSIDRQLGEALQKVTQRSMGATVSGQQLMSYYEHLVHALQDAGAR